MGQPEALVLFLVNNIARSERIWLPEAHVQRLRSICRKRARLQSGSDAPRFALSIKEAEYGSRVLSLSETMQSDASRSTLDHEYWRDLVVRTFVEEFARKPYRATIRKLDKRMALFIDA